MKHTFNIGSVGDMVVGETVYVNGRGGTRERESVAATRSTDESAQKAEIAESLTHEDLLRVHASAVALSLGDCRLALLGGISPDVGANLPVLAEPSAQLLSDLQRLNTVCLTENLCAMLIWLRNAIALRGAHDEGRVFAHYVEILSLRREH